MIRIHAELSVRAGRAPVVAWAGAALLLATAPLQAGPHGTISADTRVRYETADIEGFEDADNLSGRLRLGYTTPAWQGLQATVEGEFTGVADEGAYNAAGVHGNPQKATIADPKNVELDQALVAYTNALVAVKLGRQVIALDDQRFVGDVGWRQNRQTFDAAGIRLAGGADWQAYYAFVDNVVRIFGYEAPDSGANAGESESSSHLLNAAYQVAAPVKVTGYSYLLDLSDLPPAASVNTVGGSLTGSVPIQDGVKLDYRAEVASQTDAGDNGLDYRAEYYRLTADATLGAATAGAGYEVLGAQDTGAVDADGQPVFASFQSPLATLHKFNGFADRFLVTPPKGLEDAFASLGYRIPLPKAIGPLLATVIYHDFQSAEGDDDLGHEWDGVLTKPLKFESIPGDFKAIAKVASYQKGDTGADTERASLELNYGVAF